MGVHSSRLRPPAGAAGPAGFAGSAGPGDASLTSDPAGRAAAAFQDAYGHAPAGVWAAPGRVNLIGEHTDYNDGFVLPFALPRHVAVAARRRTDGVCEVRSLQRPAEPVRFVPDELAPGSVGGWGAYVAGVAWALRSAGHAVGGADLQIDSGLPLGSGLSSSAALECAVAMALDDLYGLGVSRHELARLAQRAENDFVGMPCGIMDQSAALLCREGNLLFLDTRDRRAEQVPFDVVAASVTVLVVDTNAPRRLVEGEYAARRQDCERAAGLLGVRALRDIGADGLPDAVRRLGDPVTTRRVRHVVTENDRVLAAVSRLRSGGIAGIAGIAGVSGIGELLTASHASLRDDFEVSWLEADVTVDAALAAGAAGARMTGGGFGGAVIALVAANTDRAVRAAISRAYEERGWQAPTFIPATPSAGAVRVG